MPGYCCADRCYVKGLRSCSNERRGAGGGGWYLMPPFPHILVESPTACALCFSCSAKAHTVVPFYMRTRSIVDDGIHIDSYACIPSLALNSDFKDEIYAEGFGQPQQQQQQQRRPETESTWKGSIPPATSRARSCRCTAPEVVLHDRDTSQLFGGHRTDNAKSRSFSAGKAVS